MAVQLPFNVYSYQKSSWKSYQCEACVKNRSRSTWISFPHLKRDRQMKLYPKQQHRLHSHSLSCIEAHHIIRPGDQSPTRHTESLNFHNSRSNAAMQDTTWFLSPLRGPFRVDRPAMTKALSASCVFSSSCQRSVDARGCIKNWQRFWVPEF